ncbi:MULTISPECIES: hypothetical protein [unclassified Streptomyces]|uniref:hypothetical protein n=1 Tax=unclassified Streptomyces TaxID=2593676 RepID=UPI0006F1C49A|nr:MULTISPECIES: hypothetical protein [unclassified Streptomyces]KQX51021.1 hypothetical protein ASD33_13585 [Streptomyces sp. Root1304]KRA85187.1 hypothetical protein ASE09_13590 [Streptomyces sp. Root66D1]
MKSLATAAVAAATLATLATGQEAVAAPTGPVGAVVTCGTPGAPGILLTRACVEVTGNQVRFYGVAATTNSGWQPQQVGFTVSGTVVGSAPIAPINPTVLVQAGTTSVGSIVTTAPCGSTVNGNFSVNQWGWPPSTATVSAVVSC